MTMTHLIPRTHAATTLSPRRRAAALGIMLALGGASLLGCATISPVKSTAAGEVHNEGVRYVFANIERMPDRNNMVATFNAQIQTYCRTIGRTCASFDRNPADSSTLEELLASGRASPAFNDSVRALFRPLQEGGSFRTVDRALAVAERNGRAGLHSIEREHFANIASIARSSARLWAPVADGGQGGGGVRFQPGTARKDIDWKEVAAADAEGCLATLPIGCVEGAIVASLIDIAIQLTR